MHRQGLWGIVGGREAGSRGKASKGPEQDPGVHVQNSGKRLERFIGAGTSWLIGRTDQALMAAVWSPWWVNSARQGFRQTLGLQDAWP